MAELSEKKKGIEELLEKITPEKRWATTAKILSALLILRGDKFVTPLMGKTEGFISPLWGWEKSEEIDA